MFNNYMNILIVPPKNGRVIRFRLSAFLFYLLLLILGTVVVGSSLLAVDYMLVKEMDEEQRQVRKAMMLQKFKFRELENRLEKDRQDLEVFTSFERKLRLISGLKEMPPNIRFVDARWDSPSEQRSDQSNYTSLLDELHTLDLEVKLRTISFFQLDAYLQEQKDRLARTPSIRPMEGSISSKFGMRTDPLTGKRRHHNGLDISNRMFTPIHSPADGVVVATAQDRDFGQVVVIDHGYGVVTRYGHVSKFEVDVGQYVKRGDLICRMGKRGRSSGPHLHYEVLKNDRYVDPLRYILD